MFITKSKKEAVAIRDDDQIIVESIHGDTWAVCELGTPESVAQYCMDGGQ
jgi:hypothetical protein